ncbi:hypothetical protein HQ48_03825 [Porphyromonas sp. COT-290 OH3588]|nr:hypothetical protein HQ48_03825 [Porphyromonas sp. COT-290 OH3588]
MKTKKKLQKNTARNACAYTANSTKNKDKSAKQAEKTEKTTPQKNTARNACAYTANSTKNKDKSAKQAEKTEKTTPLQEERH